jgi:NAD(P)-dependent dehydrogenase (short-subunit alcohol dehydrogenase family)
LGDGAVPVACELSDPDSVRACVEQVKELDSPLDVLLCNAGIMALPERELVHGHEKQFFTNHIGHFMLVTGLLESLSDDGRVVMLSSSAHGWAPRDGIQFDDLAFANGYKPNLAYGQSKLANLLFARALARRFEGTNKTANAVHPGVIATNLARHMNVAIRLAMPLFSAIVMKSIPQGAATQCYVAVHPALKSVSGEYFADCNLARSSRHSRDEAMGERLWQVSEEIVAGL